LGDAVGVLQQHHANAFVVRMRQQLEYVADAFVGGELLFD
jgi:hypothetical protein